jgi:hypothetical protein
LPHWNVVVPIWTVVHVSLRSYQCFQKFKIVVYNLIAMPHLQTELYIGCPTRLVIIWFIYVFPLLSYYLQYLIVGITIIAGNSYNISDCNQTLAPPFSSTKIYAFLANSAQRSYLSSKFEQHGTESTTTNLAWVSLLLAERGYYTRRRLHTCHASRGSPAALARRRRRCQSSAQWRRHVTGEDGLGLGLAPRRGGGRFGVAVTGGGNRAEEGGGSGVALRPWSAVQRRRRHRRGAVRLWGMMVMANRSGAVVLANGGAS